MLTTAVRRKDFDQIVGRMLAKATDNKSHGAYAKRGFFSFSQGVNFDPKG
jgi:hypothetical protein